MNKKPLAYAGLIVGGYVFVSMTVGLCKLTSHLWQDFSYEQPRSQLHSSKLTNSAPDGFEKFSDLEKKTEAIK